MEALLAWLSRNVTLVSALTSLIMVGVWAFYAHLFFRDFRSRHHPHLMIHQAPDTYLDSVCLVINMSANMVNVVCVIAVGRGPHGAWQREVTDYRQFSSDEAEDGKIESLLKQGPVAPGNYIHLGSFDKLSGLKSNDDQADSPLPIDALEIRVVAYFASERKPVGAVRSFRVIRREGKIHMVPKTRHTIQLHSFWRRKKARRWMDEIFT